MSDPLISRQEPVTDVQPPGVRAMARIRLDDRRPQLLNHHGHVLQIVSGYVDLFAVRIVDGKVETARQHLFRVESGEIIPDLFWSDSLTQVIAVGGGGTEALVVRREDVDDKSIVDTWITKLAKVIAGPNPSWEIRDATDPLALEMKAGEQRRGPARNIVWVSVQAGSALLKGHEPAYHPGSAPVPLAAGMWIVAGQASCMLSASGRPSGAALWDALDHFHRCAMECIRDLLKRIIEDDRSQLVRRSELTSSQAFELFGRLSAIIVRRSDEVETVADSSDALLAACRTVAEEIKMPIIRPPG